MNVYVQVNSVKILRYIKWDILSGPALASLRSIRGRRVCYLCGYVCGCVWVIYSVGGNASHLVALQEVEHVKDSVQQRDARLNLRPGILDISRRPIN